MTNIESAEYLLNDVEECIFIARAWLPDTKKAIAEIDDAIVKLASAKQELLNHADGREAPEGREKTGH